MRDWCSRCKNWYQLKNTCKKDNKLKSKIKKNKVKPMKKDEKSNIKDDKKNINKNSSDGDILYYPYYEISSNSSQVTKNKKENIKKSLNPIEKYPKTVNNPFESLNLIKNREDEIKFECPKCFEIISPPPTTFEVLKDRIKIYSELDPFRCSECRIVIFQFKCSVCTYMFFSLRNSSHEKTSKCPRCELSSFEAYSDDRFTLLSTSSDISQFLSINTILSPRDKSRVLKPSPRQEKKEFSFNLS